ncbi:MAG: SH3 domain-containing protein [Clostridia bacterium]|nr:SH3 domain-containing protein [Clostridia bacterium]
MKRNYLRTIVCLVLIAMTALAPLTTASASSYAHILKVNVSDARLREGPGNTDVIVKLRRSQKVLYWGEDSGNYCKVATIDGTVGYIYEDYLSAYGTVKKSMLYTTEDRTAFYKKSGSSMRRSGSISADELVLVYKTNGNWASIKTLSGKTGYCKLSDLNDLF